jgi:hypothetical protein
VKSNHRPVIIGFLLFGLLDVVVLALLIAVPNLAPSAFQHLLLFRYSDSPCSRLYQRLAMHRQAHYKSQEKAQAILSVNGHCGSLPA